MPLSRKYSRKALPRLVDQRIDKGKPAHLADDIRRLEIVREITGPDHYATSSAIGAINVGRSRRPPPSLQHY